MADVDERLNVCKSPAFSSVVDPRAIIFIPRCQVPCYEVDMREWCRVMAFVHGHIDDVV